MTTLFVLPGASLMDVTPVAGGVRVSCPGCGRIEVFRGTGHRAFAHDDGCPVHERIEQAIRQHEMDVVNRG